MRKIILVLAACFPLFAFGQTGFINSNGLRVDNSQRTQVVGGDAVGTASSVNPFLDGCIFLTTPTTLANGQAGALQCDSLQNILVKISAALPAGTAVIGHVIADSGSTTAVSGNVTVVQPTGTNLHAVLDTTSTTAVTQPTGTNLHAVIDTGSTTAVTGNVTVVQPTGTNLHAVLDTTSTTAVTQATGTNLHTVIDSGAVTNTPPANQSVNVAQINGVTTTTGSGVTGTGVQRVVLATDVAIALGAATISQTSNSGAMAANDPAGTARILAVGQFGFDGTNSQQTRIASLANSSPSSGAFTIVPGLQMVEKGPRWAISNVSAGGSQGTISIAAASAKRHVVDCIGFSADSSAAVTAANGTLNVRDGATGAGTAIWSYALSFPTAAALGVQEIPVQHLCGLNLIGTTNTAMTIEFSAGVTGSIQAVNMSGYDIN